MSGDNQTSADVKPAFSHITDADVTAWFKARAEATKLAEFSLGCSTAYSAFFTASIRNDYYGFGATVDEAVSDLRSKLKPAHEIAAKKRSEAAKLMAEADAIESAGKEVAA